MEPYVYRVNVRSIYDADTMTVDIDQGFNSWYLDVDIRLSRINAFEVRLSSKTSQAQKAKGIEARDYVRDLLEEKEVMIKTIKPENGRLRGKYGRILAEVYYKNEEDEWINLNDELVDLKMAKYEKY